MSDTLTATATVATATPGRYAKQLASHLGRRCEVREESDGIRLVLPTGGDCLLASAHAALVMTASGPTQESLDQVTDVVGRHLERFGQRNELTVSWT
jgi:hypothetical protein